MTPAERRALERLTRRAAQLTPELVAAILRALALAKANLPVGEVERLIRAGRIVDAINAALPLEAIERALNPATALLRTDVLRGIRDTAPLMPPRAREAVVAFNELNPRILDAVRALDTTSIRTIVPAARQALREAVEAGIVAGENPRQTARTLREIVGLAPNQAEAVRNYRAALEAGDMAKARGYALRDRRFSHAKPPTPEQVDKMVSAYERRMRAFHAETHARTAAIESQKLGQRLAWQEAKDSGALGDAQVVKRWVATLDSRVRDEHAAMHGQEAPLDAPYATGQMYPGQGEYNCRCTEVYRVARPTFALGA